MIDQFIKSYWNYFLELEDQLLETKRYIEFSVKNKKAFSIEYLKLYQAVCSEIDVVGKEIAVSITPKFDCKHSNIKKWGFEVQKQYGFIKDKKVSFYNEMEFQPFKDWVYEKRTSTDKNGKRNTTLAVVDDKKSIIPWWSSYNQVKHQRVGLIIGTNNFQLANQNNLLFAFSALFLMESLYIEHLIDISTKNIDVPKSKLFTIK